MLPRISILKQLHTIKEALKAFPEGALIEEIEAAVSLNLNRRTLQRRLKTLEETKALKVTGKGRGTCYQLSAIDEAPLLPISSKEPSIPLSTIGQKIQNQVNRPLQARYPVGYNREFLENYIPNVTCYLTLTERKKLAQLGKTTKAEHPAGTYAKEIRNRLLIDLSWNSSRLEGNTYSLLDTQRLITFGETAEGKSTTDTQMVLNHKEAIEFLISAADDIGFNRYTILNLHALLANNLLPDPRAVGRLRNMEVGIAQSVYEPLTIPQQISEGFDLLLSKVAAIANPFEQAFFIMVQLPYLQPFDDVNKRVSRLAANIPLLHHNLSPLSFVDVPSQIYIQGMLGIYELNGVDLLKDIFIWAYERSAACYAALRQSLGDPDPFRLRYREAIRSLITEVIKTAMSPKTAAAKIANQAKQLPEQDRARFVEVVETELLALHEGNFARYQIRPTEFEAWQQIWFTKR